MFTYCDFTFIFNY